MTKEDVKILKDMMWVMITRLPEGWQKEEWFANGKKVIDNLKPEKKTKAK